MEKADSDVDELEEDEDEGVRDAEQKQQARPGTHARDEVYGAKDGEGEDAEEGIGKDQDEKDQKGQVGEIEEAADE